MFSSRPHYLVKPPDYGILGSSGFRYGFNVWFPGPADVGRAALYVFADAGAYPMPVIYVGETSDLWGRLCQWSTNHHAAGRIKRLTKRPLILVTTAPVDKAWRCAFEADLVRQQRPPANL